MRILGIGEYCDLGAMYHRLQDAGHEVRVFIESPSSQDVFSGMLERCDDWSQQLGWVREAGRDGLVLFESALKGQLQDDLRRDGFQVIGGSALGDRLEADRAFGQQSLRAFGLPTAATHAFNDFRQARAFVERRPRRYVFKNNGADSPRSRNYIGQLDDGQDMCALLSLYQSQAETQIRNGNGNGNGNGRGNGHFTPQPCTPDFVLMEHLQGVEVGVGAYFNGHAFLDAVCMDWEHKRFFPGDLGELTGEMGTIVSYRGARKIFDATLGLLTPALREGGYCGYINLNLIANAEGLWPLEFTSRFGYPGFAICQMLHEHGWGQIFRTLLDRQSLSMATRPGFAAGVVLTVPPFPYAQGYVELAKGSPICLQNMTPADHAALHFAEVARINAHLVTSGATGYVGVATGAGNSVNEAADRAYRLARKVIVPNLRFRTDIGDKVIRHDLAHLTELGYIG